jgi:hypothetical protein
MPVDNLTSSLQIPDESTIVLLGLRVEDWGRTLVLPARFRTPDGVEGAFTITLTDCREMRWRLYAHHQAEGAALVDFALGTPQHRKPANVLSEAFGLTVLYGACHIARANDHTPSPTP